MSYTAVFVLTLVGGEKLRFTEEGNWIDADDCIDYVVTAKSAIPELNPHLDIDFIEAWCPDPEEIK